MKKSLYLGLEFPLDGTEWIHFPVIKILPRQIDTAIFKEFDKYTHFLFTSKSSVKILNEITRLPPDRIIISVGNKTSTALMNNKTHPSYTAKEETAEGIIELLENLSLENAHIFWPHSSLSRPVLSEYFQRKGINYTECILYDTVLNIPGPIPDLQNIVEIMFTSPSTVDNFLLLCPHIPSHIILTAIGPITERHLASKGYRLQFKKLTLRTRKK